MLSRAEAPNLSPLITLTALNSVSSSFQSRKRLCKSWPSWSSSSRNDLLSESPSPSSTISSSFASEGGAGAAAAGGALDVSSLNVVVRSSSCSLSRGDGKKWSEETEEEPGITTEEDHLLVVANDPTHHDEAFLTAMDELESMFRTSPAPPSDLSLMKLLFGEGTEDYMHHLSAPHQYRQQLDLQEAIDAQLSCIKAPPPSSPSPFQPAPVRIDSVPALPSFPCNVHPLPARSPPFLIHHESFPARLSSNSGYTKPQMFMVDRQLPGPYVPFQEAAPSLSLPSMPFYVTQENNLLRKSFASQMKPEPEQQPSFIHNTAQVATPARGVKTEPKAENSMLMSPARQHIPLAEPQRLSLVVQGGRDEMQFTLVDHLLKAAEAVELGNLAIAEAILARLNQYLSPHGNPLHRAAFHFKEALLKRVAAAQLSDKNGSFDILAKINAYKIFCEFSVLPQFAHFTANQALLEAMEGEGSIHLIDFEVGFGGQWASFLQDIAMRPGGPPRLRITTVSGSESIEMQLTRDNLREFARSVNASLDFQVICVPKLDNLTPSMFKIREREAVAVNFAFGFNQSLTEFSSTECFSAFCQLLNQLSPKVITVVDMESECDHGSSLKQFQHSLQFYASLFSSFESMISLPMEAILEIEKLLFAPRITSLVRGSNKSFQWATVLRRAGFSPIPFSSIAEIQANCLIQNLEARSRGFTVGKYQESLLLGWQGKTLLSACAWSR